MRVVFGVVVPMLLASACSTTPLKAERITSEVAEVEIEESREASFERVVVLDRNGITAIRGRTLSCSTCSGHVHVAVMGTDGQVLDEIAVANDRRHPRRPTTSEWAGTFRAEVPYAMEPGMRIVLTYHHGILRRAHRE